MFAAVIVVAFTFRHHIRAVIKGPGDAGPKVETSHGRQGELTATDSTGRGIEAKTVEAGRDIHISSIPPQRNFDRAEQLLNDVNARDLAEAQELQELITKRLLSAA